MSKIIEKYENLKKENPEKLYLFKSGIFYIFINEDAKLINEKLGLKITDFGINNIKCGFPNNNLNKYLELLNTCNCKYELIESTSKNTIKIQENYNNEIIKKLKKLDLSNTTPIEAFNFLHSIQKELNTIQKK